MRIIYSLMIFTILAALPGCSTDPKYVLKTRIHQLDQKSLYDEMLAYDVVFDAEEGNADSLKDESKTRFLKGIDLFRNKHNPFAAIPLFKEAAIIFPDAKVYYELGNALLESNQGTGSCKEAIKAYQVAEHLGFQPLAHLYFQRACAQYQLQLRDEAQMWSVLWSLRCAFTQGGFDSVKVGSSKWLRGITELAEYRSMVTDFKATLMTQKGDPVFNLYKNAFVQQVNQFEIGVDDVEMKAYRESISYSFSDFIPEMENTSFGRTVSNDYYYVGKVKETDRYVALLYTSVSFEGDLMQPVYTKLVVYDPNGEIIDEKLVSCQCSAERIKRCVIKDTDVLVEEYQRIWEKPLTAESFENNKVKEHQLRAKATYKISDTGKINEIDVPAGFEDTTAIAKNN